jgi:hypothetical protein
MQSEASLSPAACELTQFLKGLMEDGRAIIAATPLLENHAAALSALREIDQRARDEINIDAPAFLPEAGLWAARLTYHLAQFIVCRDIGQEQIDATCNLPCPSAPTAEVIWSVDLTLRHLPRLFRLARHVSGGDPLVKQMERIASEWPLSSIGILGIANPEIGVIASHPALARIYADRIFAEADLSRIGHPLVDDRLRADLGMHRDLAPALARKLFVETHESN